MVTEGRKGAIDPAARRSDETSRDGFNNIDVHCIAERLASGGVSFRKMLQASHALQAGAFAHCHVTPFPRNDGDLARCEGHERGSCSGTFCTNPGRSELNYGAPKIARTVLPIPFEFLEAGGKSKN
jgi:hypothetical protein